MSSGNGGLPRTLAPLTGEISDEERARKRVEDALNDETGRLKLFINDLSFPRLDSEICRLDTLEQLHCQNNPLLTSLPPSLSKLRNLRVVNVSHCSLRELPEELGQLPALESLDVSHNALCRFVWDVSRWIPNLKELKLSHNNFTHLSPGCVPLLSSLQKRFEEYRRVQFIPQRTIDIWPNDKFFSPLETQRLSTAEEQYALQEMLPECVEKCHRCGCNVLVGRPTVYAHFWRLDMSQGPIADGGPSSGDNDESEVTSESSAEALLPSTKSQLARSAARNAKAVTILYPLCRSVDCHLALHKAVLTGRLTSS